MYMLPDMVGIGLQNGIKDGVITRDEWTSEDHKIVAQNLLLCNPNIRTADDMVHNVKIINAIPQDQIRLVTGEDLQSLGCYF